MSIEEIKPTPPEEPEPPEESPNPEAEVEPVPIFSIKLYDVVDANGFPTVRADYRFTPALTPQQAGDISQLTNAQLLGLRLINAMKREAQAILAAQQKIVRAATMDEAENMANRLRNKPERNRI